MPNLQKVEWKKDQKEAFRGWFSNQLFQTIGDRGGLEAKWRNQLIQWRAQVVGDGIGEVPFVGAPYSRDTEILTEDGWQRIDEVEIGQKVLTRKDNEGELEWHPIEAKPSIFAKELIHFSSHSIDMLVTPQHTMVAISPLGVTRRFEAQELAKKVNYGVPLTGKWKGKNPEYLFHLDSGDVAEFVGWYLAEGWSKATGTIMIGQSREANPKNCNRLEALFARMGFTWTEIKNGSGYQVHARSMPKAFADMIRLQGHCHEKYVPKIFFDLSPQIIERLVEGLILGDGTITTYEPTGNSVWRLYTTSPQLADDVQILVQLMGKRGVIYSRNRIGALVGAGHFGMAKYEEISVGILSRTRSRTDRCKIEAVEYNDIAYCITVKNHAVYVRRNGKAGWSGNSDIDMPLTAMHTDPVFADFMQTLHAPADFWTVTATRPDLVDSAKPLQEFLSLYEKQFIKIRQVNSKALFDAIIHGTGIYKDMILHERKKVRDYNEVGEIEEVTKIKFQATIQHVPLTDLYVPANAIAIDPDNPVRPAAWVAHRFHITESQFKLRRDSESPFLPSYDKKEADVIASWDVDVQSDDIVLEQQRLEDDFKPFQDRKIILYEVWARFDVDGDGIEEDIVVVWHHNTRRILRTTFNPFIHGKRPFEAIQYLPSGGFYGMGMAEIDEWAQITASRLMNSMVDSSFLANTMMLGMPAGANIAPDEAFYPGKVFPLGPNEKITQISMGTPYAGIMNNIQAFMQWSEQRTAVSELRQGDISQLPSRTPATSVLSLLAESNQRFDMIIANMREPGLNNLGIRILQNLTQISKDDPRWIAKAIQWLGEVDGAKVAAILQGPVHQVETDFGVSVSATSSKSNKEVDKQNLIFLSQIMEKSYAQLIGFGQLLEQVQPGTMMAVIQSAFSGTVEMQKRLLEAHDVQNPEEYVPELPEQQLAQQQLGPQPGPAAAAPVAAPAQQQALGTPQIGQILGLG